MDATSAVVHVLVNYGIWFVGLGDLLMSTHPVLASRLKEISAVTVAVVSFEFDGKVLPTEVCIHVAGLIDRYVVI
jgi:hypothetical protein